MVKATEYPATQLEALGSFIRSQRKNAELSLRELADKTGVSNPYLSQLERGLHEPSMRVLSAIAEALEVSIETLLSRAGLLRDADPSGTGVDTAAVIAVDPELTNDQRTALLAVYQSYVEANRAIAKSESATAQKAENRPKAKTDAKAKSKAKAKTKPKTGASSKQKPPPGPQETEPEETEAAE